MKRRKGFIMARSLKVISVLVVMAMMASCGMPMDEFDIMPPQVSRISHTYKQLSTLPPPKGKIRVCVYNFRDQTGQYKPLPNVSSFSTAVTQGAVNMLIEALNRSKWFIPVERDGLQSLLTERKIITAAKRNGNGDKGNGLPPLESANILLQGGITSYETNTLTGGFGAKYWGLGGSVQYRMDQVTVHLRAVDVKTGRILKSVSTTKTILSHEVDVGLYRFLTFKKLLEVEAGYSHNEPVQMCVAAAIEKAVIAMVFEGVLDGLWYLQNPEDINSPAMKAYQEETQRVAIQAELKAAAAKAAADRRAAINEAAFEKLQKAEEQHEAEKAEIARLEAEKKAQLEAARQEAERKAQEAAEARKEAEQKAQEQAAARLEAEQKAKAEETARLEAEQKAKAEETARLELERKAQEAAEARKEAEQKAQEQAAARLEAEQKAKAEETARLEAEQKAKQEEEVRLELERKAQAEGEARLELQQKAQEQEAARWEAERKAEAEEAARIEAEKKAQAEEAARLEAEQKAKAEEAARVEAEKKTQEEAARIEAEKKAQAEEAARVEAEKKAQEEAAAKEKLSQANKKAHEPELVNGAAQEIKPVDSSFVFSKPMVATAESQEAPSIQMDNITLKKWQPFNTAQ
jgi:curli production assembly/transport component CsgG